MEEHLVAALISSTRPESAAFTVSENWIIRRWDTGKVREITGAALQPPFFLTASKERGGEHEQMAQQSDVRVSLCFLCYTALSAVCARLHGYRHHNYHSIVRVPNAVTTFVKSLDHPQLRFTAEKSAMASATARRCARAAYRRQSRIVCAAAISTTRACVG